jgi:hypothetical protein
MWCPYSLTEIAFRREWEPGLSLVVTVINLNRRNPFLRQGGAFAVALLEMTAKGRREFTKRRSSCRSKLLLRRATCCVRRPMVCPPHGFRHVPPRHR